jgi:ParB-like chromosome segregation protein Spo0J
MKIEQIVTDKLIPYANNSRTHSEAQVAQIAASIRQFGFNNPVLIDEQSTIIAGHGRVLAALKLEMEKVPCIRLSHLNESQRKAYIIADNKIALNSGWDEELLKLELEGLTDIDQIATGFSPEELNVLFEGWQSNIDLHEKDGSNLDGILSTIKIGVSQEEKDFAHETITNALDQAGISYEFK